MSSREGEGAHEEQTARSPVPISVERKYIDYIAENSTNAYQAWKHFRAKKGPCQE